jgi:hypothetical protein
MAFCNISFETLICRVQYFTSWGSLMSIFERSGATFLISTMMLLNSRDSGNSDQVVGAHDLEARICQVFNDALCHQLCFSGIYRSLRVIFSAFRNRCGDHRIHLVLIRQGNLP